MIQPRSEVLDAPKPIHGGPAGVEDERHPVRIDFSVSLNAWGPAPEVRDAVLSTPLEQYPDPESLAPRRAAARRWGVLPETVVFGAGAAELIHVVCSAFLRPGSTVLIPGPTFGEYARAAILYGARLAHHLAAPPAWVLDAASIASAVAEHSARLVFLCAPNNPTGQALGREEVEHVADTCAATGALLILDQAYDPFTPQPLGTPALPGHPAVLHLRSITKDHTLAGLRAAFAVGPEPIITALERARVPWAASAPAQAAAVAALGDAAEAHLAVTLPRLRAERARLQGAFAWFGIRTLPSQTHYFLAEVGDAAAVRRRLQLEWGIKVRDCTSFGLPRHIRVAARTPGENNLLIQAMEATCSASL